MLFSPSVDPAAPLLTVYRAQLTPFPRKLVVSNDLGFKIGLRDLIASFLYVARKRPITPYTNVLKQKFTNVGATGKKPEHLLNRGFPVYALGREYWHFASAEVKPQQFAEQGFRANARSVDALVALFQNTPEKL